MPKWSNPLAKYGIYWKEIERQPEVNKAVNDFMENEVLPTWQSFAPVDSGEYRDSIQITEKSTNKGRGKVEATADNAVYVEFGGQNTPEYAPAEKTARKYGGTAHGKS
jgi:hypothetical protein